MKKTLDYCRRPFGLVLLMGLVLVFVLSKFLSPQPRLTILDPLLGPNSWQNFLVFFLGGGLAYFVGLGFIFGAWVLWPWANIKWILNVRNVLVFLGYILIGIAACPLPWWLYALMAWIFFTWLIAEWFKERLARRWLYLARGLMLGLIIMALDVELPYHFLPVIPPAEKSALWLIGDSVSAGMGGEKGHTWPNLFARQYGVEVHDLSQAGATAHSAFIQADRLEKGAGLVLLEIGGNDVLGTTTSAKFREDLEKLLARVCCPGRTVVMLELPLPPLANNFGIAQRDLAKKYDVILVPKRIFVSVLSTSGATLDGIHLSPQGHQLMVETMWQVLGNALARR